MKEKTISEFVEKDKMLQNLIRDLPRIIAAAPLIAKIQRAAFDSLVGEGFSEDQALEIIKARGTMP